MERIEQALKDRAGIDSASIGSSSIRRFIRSRMKHHAIKEPKDYLVLLQRSKREWNDLIESVLVPETWFFRDAEPFTTLAEVVMNEWVAANPSSPLRLLSLPCSSGEEPYSLVMTLLNAGFPQERLQIDAIDISARTLAKAKRAIYGNHSFRGGDLNFRDKYFRSTPDGYIFDPAIARLVQFYPGNLLAEEFATPRSSYHFIFCRNLLVYFGPDAREKALAKIRTLLTPQALLFVGAAEQQFVLEHGFESAHWPMAFACRKSRIRNQSQTNRAFQPVSQAASDSVEQFIVPPAGSVSQNIAAAHRLDFAKQLADAGRLQEAASICQEHLRHATPSAEAYYLLGLIYDAHGDPAAPEFYRKALYLEPSHYDSLLQLALLSEKNGDTTVARRLMTRAKRVKSV